MITYNIMSKKFLLGLVIFIAVCLHNANAQTVYFNGLGRALVTTDQLKGNALTINEGGVTRPDTLSGRRGTGGYTIFDLGVNAQPNENLRASAILRIRNDFGGFYGNGSSVFFRQLRLDGVIAKIVKYEIGDIDLGLTPYTLYNFDESYHDYEADVFAIRRSIVNYENFNFGNKWRLQGAHANANFRFTKGIEKIGVRVFAARAGRKDILDLVNPDRVNWGGRVDLVQSKFFHIGGNFIQMVDLAGTVPVNQFEFDNKVGTVDFKLGYDNDQIGAFAYGEAGFSKYSFFRAQNDTTVSKNGNFYDVGVSAEYKPLKVKLFVSYRNVSDNFSSPGAQTRRIFDYGNPVAPTPFAPELFPTIKGGVIRQVGLLDRISDEDVRNLNIMPVLMAYRPEYNNITPYGTATPNRKGISFGASVGEMEKVVKGDVKVDLLSEVVGEGSTDTRKFTGVRGGLFFNVNKLVNWERALGLNFGFRYEHTKRDGGNQIDLKSTLIDAGINVEVVKSFDLIAGYKMLTAKGNEFLLARNEFNEVVNPVQGYSDVDQANTILSQGFNQGLLAAGIRYRFTKNTYFTGQAVFYNNKSKLQTSLGDFDYKINQIFLNYTMVF